jgi:hypothetical protein
MSGALQLIDAGAPSAGAAVPRLDTAVVSIRMFVREPLNIG